LDIGSNIKRLKQKEKGKIMITTELPIGTLEVSENMARVVHILAEDESWPNDILLMNKIVYPCVLKHYMGRQGHIVCGWTLATTIDPLLFSKVTDKSNVMLNLQTTKIFDSNSGKRIT